MEEKIPDILFDYVKKIIYEPQNAALDLGALPEEFRRLGEGLQFLCECLRENKAFGTEVACGNLNASPPSPENVIAAPFMRIQNDLKHLTRFTQQVAKGDYNQQLDYMGAFSEAFNSMALQLKKKTERLERMAYTDELTGVYNRQYADQFLDGLWDKKEAFSIAYVDIDQLKYCNDHFGHCEGDAYIMTITTLLQEICGGRDRLCRMGGDEFLTIFRSGNSCALEGKLEEKRSEALKMRCEKWDYPHSFSYGCVDVNPSVASNLRSYLHEADEKMYCYKREKEGCDNKKLL